MDRELLGIMFVVSLWGAVVLLFAGILYVTHEQSNDCAKTGGVLVRSAYNGLVCVRGMN